MAPRSQYYLQHFIFQTFGVSPVGHSTRKAHTISRPHRPTGHQKRLPPETCQVSGKAMTKVFVLRHLFLSPEPSSIRKTRTRTTVNPSKEFLLQGMQSGSFSGKENTIFLHLTQRSATPPTAYTSWTKGIADSRPSQSTCRTPSSRLSPSKRTITVFRQHCSMLTPQQKK